MNIIPAPHPSPAHPAADPPNQSDVSCIDLDASEVTNSFGDPLQPPDQNPELPLQLASFCPLIAHSEFLPRNETSLNL